MYCRACGYALRGAIGRCPECGAAFDSDDPRTFRRSRPISIGGLAVRIGAALLAVWVPCFLVGLLMFPPQMPAAGWRNVAGTSAWLAAVAAITVGIPGVVTYLVLRRS